MRALEDERKVKEQQAERQLTEHNVVVGHHVSEIKQLKSTVVGLQDDLARSQHAFSAMKQQHEQLQSTIDHLEKECAELKSKTPLHNEAGDLQKLKQFEETIHALENECKGLRSQIKEHPLATPATDAVQVMADLRSAVASRDSEIARLKAKVISTNEQLIAQKSSNALGGFDNTSVQQLRHTLQHHAERAQLDISASQSLVDTMCRVLAVSDAKDNDVKSLLEAWRIHCEVALQRQQENQSVEVAKLLAESEKQTRETRREYEDKLSALMIERDMAQDELRRLKSSQGSVKRNTPPPPPPLEPPPSRVRAPSIPTPVSPGLTPPPSRPEERKNWPCPRCTLINVMSNQHCEACRAPKP
jgi:chromosome segregation ATPase